MRVNTNVGSLNAWRNLTSTDGAMSKSLERLSSGFRINRAADDVAGLAISENMRAQVKGLNQAVKNAQDGISLLQTAEGSLNEVHSMLQRMRELAVQSANGTLQPEDRSQVQTEMDNLAKEVTRITNATQFNSKDLLDGSLQKAGGAAAYGQGGIDQISLQIGPNSGQTVAFEVGAMDAQSLGIARDVMTAEVYSDDGTGEAVKSGSVVSGVSSTGAVGAGITSGQYRVFFDAAAQTVQLQNSSGTAIGTAANAVDANGNFLSSVTIGDTTTAQTMAIQMDPAGVVPGANATDYLNIGSRVGAVDAAGTVIDTTFAATGGTGISAVGWGLTGTSYDVAYDDTAKTLQLKDSSGTNIGSAITYTTGVGSMDLVGATNLILGDQATGRTLTINVQAGLDAGGNLSDTVTVNNNGQAAEDAKFTGGVKYGSSQAFAGLNVSSVTGAQSAITAIDSAIAQVSYQRSQMGAIQNRLDHTINNLQVVSENLTASESRIRDVDMALEMASFTKQQILMQSGTAMLAQANQKNQAVLSLLR
jgi:flagellin